MLVKNRFRDTIRFKFIFSVTAFVAIAAAAVLIFSLKGYYAPEQIPVEPITVTEYIEVPVQEKKVLDLGLVQENVTAIGQLSTSEYLYTDSAYSEEAKFIKEMKIPLTTNHLLFRWDGCIKAGIDATQISIEVDEPGKIITVGLPKAEILSHEIDWDSFEVLDEKNNIFNPIGSEDMSELIATSLPAMEKRAIENGLLEKADEEAATLIKSFLNSLPEIKGEYKVQFASAEEN